MNISLKKTLKYFLTLTVDMVLSFELVGLVHEILGHGLCAYLLGGSFDGYTTSDDWIIWPTRRFR